MRTMNVDGRAGPCRTAVLLASLIVGGCGGGSSGVVPAPQGASDAPQSGSAPSDDDPSPGAAVAPPSPLVPPPLAPPDGPDSTYYTGTSTALLQGPVIGDGSESNVTQRRTLPVDVEFANEGLAIREAALLRLNNEEARSLVFVVENTSSRTLCDVDLDEIELFRIRPDGTEDDGGRYRASVLGAYSVEPPGQFGERVPRCIAPNALAYAIGRRTPETDFRGTISRVVVGRLSHDRDSHEIDRSPIEPVAYDTRLVGLNDVEIELTVVNRSATSARLGRLVFALLDESGRVVRLTSDSSRWDRSDFMDAGEEAVLILDEVPDYRGTVSTIRFFMDVDGSI